MTPIIGKIENINTKAKISPKTITDLVLLNFEYYKGNQKWCENKCPTEWNGLMFCELCGRVNMNSVGVFVDDISNTLGKECGCLETFYQQLEEKYHHEKILGLKPGWIVLGVAEQTLITNWF